MSITITFRTSEMLLLSIWFSTPGLGLHILWEQSLVLIKRSITHFGNKKKLSRAESVSGYVVLRIYFSLSLSLSFIYTQKSLAHNRKIPLNGLKINISPQKKGRNSNDSFEVSSTCCDRNNKLIGTITDSL